MYSLLHKTIEKCMIIEPWQFDEGRLSVCFQTFDGQQTTYCLWLVKAKKQSYRFYFINTAIQTTC